jgi:hypothetical protein
MTPHQFFCALTNELTEHTAQANSTPKGWCLLKLLGTRIESLLHPPPISEEQRVIAGRQRKAREAEQRVTDDSPIITIPRITDAPLAMLTCNPTAKQTLQTTPRLHRHVTRNNTPGILPEPNVITPTTTPTATAPCRARPIAPTRIQPSRESHEAHTVIQGSAQQRIVTRHAINLLTLHEQVSFSTIHTPRTLMKHAKMRVNMEHYANPMVHPNTGCTISNYKKLMHNPATAEVWQTAFGKDFGGMAQGCNKTGQKGMNAMFVMAHDEIRHALAAKNFFTYANPVVDYQPQKDDPHHIRIMVGGNFIDYDGNASVCTADINTEKLHWNSVISIENARYMCLDINFFYLTAALEYFKYMKIPLALFPVWKIEQYNLHTLALDGWVYIKMRHGVWGLPQVGILANKQLCHKLAPFGYKESVNTPGLWRHKSQPLTFTLVVVNFGVEFVNKADVNHLISSIKSAYTLTEDWTGNLYCGITLEWDYVERTVNILMPGYIKMKLQEYEHIMPKKLQMCPYLPEPKKFGTEAQAPLPHDSTPKLDAKCIKCVQKIVGSILYYARVVDMTVLMALSSIAVEQTKVTEKNNGTMHPIIGLPVGPRGRKGPIPRI